MKTIRILLQENTYIITDIIYTNICNCLYHPIYKNYSGYISECIEALTICTIKLNILIHNYSTFVILCHISLFYNTNIRILCINCISKIIKICDINPLLVLQSLYKKSLSCLVSELPIDVPSIESIIINISPRLTGDTMIGMPLIDTNIVDVDDLVGVIQQVSDTITISSDNINKRQKIGTSIIPSEAGTILEESNEILNKEKINDYNNISNNTIKEEWWKNILPKNQNISSDWYGALVIATEDDSRMVRYNAVEVLINIGLKGIKDDNSLGLLNLSLKYQLNLIGDDDKIIRTTVSHGLYTLLSYYSSKKIYQDKNIQNLSNKYVYLLSLQQQDREANVRWYGYYIYSLQYIPSIKQLKHSLLSLFQSLFYTYYLPYTSSSLSYRQELLNCFNKLYENNNKQEVFLYKRYISLDMDIITKNYPVSRPQFSYRCYETPLVLRTIGKLLQVHSSFILLNINYFSLAFFIYDVLLQVSTRIYFHGLGDIIKPFLQNKNALSTTTKLMEGSNNLNTMYDTALTIDGSINQKITDDTILTTNDDTKNITIWKSIHPQTVIVLPSRMKYIQDEKSSFTIPYLCGIPVGLNTMNPLIQGIIIVFRILPKQLVDTTIMPEIISLLNKFIKNITSHTEYVIPPIQFTQYSFSSLVPMLRDRVFVPR